MIESTLTSAEAAERLSINIPKTDQPRVVVIGGGFAGVTLARKLVGRGLQVVMLDRHNYHTFQPLLYQVATAGLEPDSIAGPLRKLFANKDFHFRLGEVQSIHPDRRAVRTAIGELEYDFLVLANGSKTNYFGNEDVYHRAFPLKQVPQALDLRSHILQNFERAVVTNDPDERKRLMTYVVVGGGPTGVEVSGALGELKLHVLPLDYPDLDLDQMRIVLVEGLDRLLPAMTEKSGQKAASYLKRFHVESVLGKRVESFDGRTVVLNDGQTFTTNTLVWAAGVTGNIIEGLPDQVVERGRIRVDAYNRVEGYEDLFAVGDVAHQPSEENPRGLPMLAPVAIQQAQRLAKNLLRFGRGRTMEPFAYKDKGSMATIGRNRAVVDFPKRHGFGGLLAWFVWMFVHLFSIIGFRNKVVVFSNWLWNYITYDRGNRLIIRPFVKKQHTE